MKFLRLINILIITLAASAAVSGIQGGRAAAERSGPSEIIRIAAGAHSSLMAGDIAAYRKHISLSEDFSFMGPFDGDTRGAAQFTDARWAEIARAFRNGRNAVFEPVACYQSPGLAVLVDIERANVEVAGLAAQDWSLRVTLVFKHVQGKWRLAHRHADPLVRSIPLETAAALADDSARR